MFVFCVFYLRVCMFNIRVGVFYNRIDLFYMHSLLEWALAHMGKSPYGPGPLEKRSTKKYETRCQGAPGQKNQKRMIIGMCYVFVCVAYLLYAFCGVITCVFVCERVSSCS